MKFVRFAKGDGAAYGIVEDGMVTEISNSPIGQDYSVSDNVENLDNVRILAPNPRPGKMLCLALNYGSRREIADAARLHSNYAANDAFTWPRDRPPFSILLRAVRETWCLSFRRKR